MTKLKFDIIRTFWCVINIIYLTDKVAELSLGDVELSLNLVIQLVVLPQPQSALARQGQTKSTIGLGQPLHGTSEQATYGQASTSINYDRLQTATNSDLLRSWLL